MADPQFYHSGQSGRFYWGDSSTASGSCRDWSFSATMATLDATTLGDTYKVPVNGIRTVTGSATLFWARETSRNQDQNAGDAVNWLMTPRGSAGDSAPGQANETPNSIRLRLTVDAGSTTGGASGRGIELRAKVTSLAMTMAHGEIFAANISFESIGAPVTVNL